MFVDLFLLEDNLLIQIIDGIRPTHVKCVYGIGIDIYIVFMKIHKQCSEISIAKWVDIYYITNRTTMK